MSRLRLALLFALAAVCGGHLASPARADVYTIDILSSEFYPQLRDSWMLQINNQGVAAGYFATRSAAGPFYPTIYHGNGNFQTLGLQSRALSSTVTGLSERGTVVGRVFNPGPTAYLYSNGTAAPPPVPPGTSTPFLSGISSAEVSYGSVFDPGSGGRKLFTVQDGAARLLPLNVPGAFSYAIQGPNRMNDDGLLAFFTTSGNEVLGNFLYDTVADRYFPVAVPSGYGFAFVDQVTDGGLVFGRVVTADFLQSRYGFWNADGSFRDFFNVPEGTYDVLVNDLGRAFGINQGQLFSFDGSGWSAQNVLGLNGYTFGRISDINDRGQVVGLVLNPQGSFAWGFVATPVVPEPSSLALFGLGLAGCAGWRRLRRDRARHSRTFVPRLEAVEDRTLPSTFTVLNLNDAGPGSLRVADGDDVFGPLTPI